METDINKLAQSFSRSFGANMRKANELPQVESLPTGLTSFDTYLTGIGGMPRGRVVEGNGIESSGKSTFAHALCAWGKARDPNFTVAWIDAEGCFEPTWAEKMGQDLSRTIFPPDDYVFAEDYLEFTKWAIVNNIDLVVWDSIASLQLKSVDDDERKAVTGPNRSLDGVRKMNLVLSLPKWISQRFMPQMMNAGFTFGKDATRYKLSQSKTIVYLINQVRANLEDTWVNVDNSTPGGQALKHMASLRLQFSKRGVSKEKNDAGDPLFQQIRIKVVKNKVGVPFRQSDYILGFDGGWKEPAESLFDLGVALGYINSLPGGYYTIPGAPEKIRGKKAVSDYLATHPEVFENRLEMDAVKNPVLTYGGDTGTTASSSDDIKCQNLLNIVQKNQG